MATIEDTELPYKPDVKHHEFEEDVTPAWQDTSTAEQQALRKREKLLVKKLDVFIAPVMM
jgi:hypothetical protein